MTDIEALTEVVLGLQRELRQHKADTANMLRVGPVIESDKDKGVRVQFGTDADPDKSAWTKSADRSGASSYRPAVGEQVLILALGGDARQAIAIPLTHSDAKPDPAKSPDETVHHDRDGQRHSVEQGHVKDQADSKHSRSAGPMPEGGSAGSPAHELNKQLQGVKAHLTQLDHNIAGLHDATSQFRDIVQKIIPAVAAVQPLLSGDAGSLDKAVQAVTGKLESYVAKSMQNMISKLTNGFMDNAMNLVGGFVNGQVGDLLGQVAALGTTPGLEAATQAALGAAVSQAQGMVAGAVGGAIAPLQAQLGAIQGILSGTPAEAAFGALQGQLGGVLGGIGPLMSGLGDLVDNQKNLTKGVTKHYRLGGY